MRNRRLSETASNGLEWDKLRQKPEWLGVGFSLLCLCAYLVGGETWLMTCVIALPAFGIFGFRLIWGQKPPEESEGSGLTTLPKLMATVEARLLEAKTTHRRFACFSVQIDDFTQLQAKYGEVVTQRVQQKIAARILRSMREEDRLARVEDGVFMLILAPVHHLDLEICVQLASRLKSAVESPIPIDATSVRLTASIGFCRSDQIEGETAEDLRTAAEVALRDASRNGASSIRSYSQNLLKRDKSHAQLCTDATRALQLDQITAWFQPQVSTETGEITGFEALARWAHPERGILAPAHFMEAIAKSNQLERLADHMLKNALEALKSWDSQGLRVPYVGVNFAGEELRNPMLVEKIHWELDRYELSPNRLAIEVLESVIAGTADGAVARNVNGLANLGCYVDLDDFGTGHASISSIRRFAVSRLKIDRSFITQIDQDSEQQKLVSAIVTMAERLGIETLAEGVETASEHSMLAQLGCTHVQGYGIARPMPFSETIPWMKSYYEGLQKPPEILREKGHGT